MSASIRIALDNKPEFYTNLDEVSGRIVLNLHRTEQISSIVVKLEGESTTALQVPHPTHPDEYRRQGPPPGPPGSIVAENHKILYKLAQVFPDEYYQSGSNPYGAHPLLPGEHAFPFKFKLPINNACSDQMAMSKIGGIAGLGGMGSGGGLFGMGGIRVMDGSKQLFLQHVTKTLPPSLTGFPNECEIRYYIKVTVQRPGLLKENWRYQTGLKFLPIEPPRPTPSSKESFAKRPFTFRPRTPPTERKKSGMFSSKKDKAAEAEGKSSTPVEAPPSVEVSARLPHPPIFTCNKPLPLRLVATKLVDSPEQVYLTSLELNLVGTTEIRCHGLHSYKVNRWVITTLTGLDIPLCVEKNEKGEEEYEIPNDIWKDITLPNTIAPSFNTCNLNRRYDLEVKLGVSWGKSNGEGGSSKNPFVSKSSSPPPQTIWLPLSFSNIEVFSGITPPPQLVQAARNTQPGRATMSFRQNARPNSYSGPGGSTSISGPGASRPGASAAAAGPSNPQQPLPPRRPSQPQTAVRPPPSDPLYPPQLQPGQSASGVDDAPPSYDEAMADSVPPVFDGREPRPAYSGVTNEDAPSQMPQGKN